jgi:hypothetical protein
MSELEGMSTVERALLAKLDGFDMSHVYRISDELHKESLRAAVVLGAAWLDEGLTALLRAALLPSGKKDDDELFGYGGPLGDFGARIKLCHRLGLLSDDVRKTIDIVRKIRNKYAHVVENQDLSASPFREWIRELPVLIPSPTFWDAYQSKYYGAERSPRVTLLCTISFVCGLVLMGASSAKQIPAQPLLPTMLAR